MDCRPSGGRTGKLTTCARWAALGPNARTYTRTAAEELAQLVQQTPGMQMPERWQDPNTNDHTSDTEQHTWDTQDFADTPGQPPELWPCWAWGYKVWLHMADQWRVGGMGGVVGLDLNALPIVEARIGMPPEEMQPAYVALRAFARAQQDKWAEDDKVRANEQRSRH